MTEDVPIVAFEMRAGACARRPDSHDWTGPAVGCSPRVPTCAKCGLALSANVELHCAMTLEGKS